LSDAGQSNLDGSGPAARTRAGVGHVYRNGSRPSIIYWESKGLWRIRWASTLRYLIPAPCSGLRVDHCRDSDRRSWRLPAVYRTLATGSSGLFLPGRRPPV